MWPELMTEGDLGELIRIHIARYDDLIRRHARGQEGIRLDECQELLSVWRSIGYKFSDQRYRLNRHYYDERERVEISDAYYDEYGQYTYPTDEGDDE